MQLRLYLKMLFVLRSLYVQKIALTSLKCKSPVGFFQARVTHAHAKMFILPFILTLAALSGGAAANLSSLLPLKSHMLAGSVSMSPSLPVPYGCLSLLPVFCWVLGLFLTIIMFQSPPVRVMVCKSDRVVILTCQNRYTSRNLLVPSGFPSSMDNVFQ